MDLTQYDDCYASAEAEAQTGGAPVPDGYYKAKVEKVELKPTREKKLPMFSWWLKITEGPQAKRLLFKNTVIRQEEDLQRLKQDLLTAGLRLNKFSDLQQDSVRAELLDTVLHIAKKTTNKDGKEYENVYINGKDDDQAAHGGGGFPDSGGQQGGGFPGNNPGGFDPNDDVPF